MRTPCVSICCTLRCDPPPPPHPSLSNQLFALIVTGRHSPGGNTENEGYSCGGASAIQAYTESGPSDRKVLVPHQIRKGTDISKSSGEGMPNSFWVGGRGGRFFAQMDARRPKRVIVQVTEYVGCWEIPKLHGRGNGNVLWLPVDTTGKHISETVVDRQTGSPAGKRLPHD